MLSVCLTGEGTRGRAAGDLRTMHWLPPGRVFQPGQQYEWKREPHTLGLTETRHSRKSALGWPKPPSSAPQTRSPSPSEVPACSVPPMDGWRGGTCDRVRALESKARTDGGRKPGSGRSGSPGLAALFSGTHPQILPICCPHASHMKLQTLNGGWSAMTFDPA